MIMENKIANAVEVDFFSELSPEEKMHADLMASISMKLHARRMELGMTQAEFAKLNNVSQVTISKWESGDYNFTLQTIAKVFTTIGLSLSFETKPQAEFEIVTNNDPIRNFASQWEVGATKTPLWNSKTASQPAYSML